MGTQLSPRLILSSPGNYLHWCPGCNRRHLFNVEQANSNGARWTFDGNVGAPTFSPSMHIRTGYQPEGFEGPDKPWVYKTLCHYFLTEGRIQFLGDCSHELAGQTVGLPDFPIGYRGNGE